MHVPALKLNKTSMRGIKGGWAMGTPGSMTSQIRRSYTVTSRTMATIIIIFSNVSMTQRWTERIACLLDVIVSKEDELPAHVYNKCITRIKALERATTDLAAYKKSAKSAMERGKSSLKRTKETTGEVGIPSERGLAVRWQGRESHSQVSR